MDVQINNICQCCFAEGCKRELYGEYEWLNQKEVPNGFICEVCIIHLRQSVTFKNKVLHTQKCFQIILHSGGETDAKVVVKKSDTSNENYISDVVKLEKFDEEEFLEYNEDVVKLEGFDNEEYLECNEEVSQCEEMPAEKRVGKMKRRKLKKYNEDNKSPNKRKRTSKEIIKNVPMKKLKGRPPSTSSCWEMSLTVRENVATLLEHITIIPFVYSTFPESYKCLFCLEPFKDILDLLNHTKTHESIDRNHLITYLKGKQNVKADISELKCKICSLADIADICSARRHLIEAHDIFFTPAGNGIIPFKILLKNGSLICHLCDKSFHSFFLLNKHLNFHYDNAICDVCGLGFVTFSRLKQHKEMHLIKEISCSKCDRKYGSISKLHEHLKKVHLLPKKKISKCTHCEERFPDHYKKLKHLKVVHGVTFKFDCDICQMVFKSRKALTRHTTKVHKQNIVCDVCKRPFAERTVLVRHMATHFEERNFACSLCEKKYKYEKNLKFHMRTHNPAWSFACAKCKEGFPTKVSFKKHEEGCLGIDDIRNESYIPAEEICI